jgi:hypothetical protein
LLLALVLPGGLQAAEKASQQVSPFLGSFSYSVPLEVPPFHGLEPRLTLAYSSEGRNGFLGVGWGLSGFSMIERANPGRGTPTFDTYGVPDVYLLDGQELVPCQQGSVSPSCTSGGTHSTKIESYLKVKATPSTNPTTWEVWGKDGTKTTFTSVFTVPPSSWLPGGTLRWGQTSTVDTYGNAVTYTWACHS